MDRSLVPEELHLPLPASHDRPDGIAVVDVDDDGRSGAAIADRKTGS